MNKTFFAWILSGVIFLATATSIAGDQFYDDVLVSKICRVYDGDTFYADIDSFPSILGKNIGIRIAGIDAPEIRTKNIEEKRLAKEARDIIEYFLTSAERIELKNLRRGKYFRIIADVYADGRNLAQVLLNAGLAHPYNGGTKPAFALSY